MCSLKSRALDKVLYQFSIMSDSDIFEYAFLYKRTIPRRVSSTKDLGWRKFVINSQI